MTALNLNEAPIRLPILRVRPEWIDYNGHMNVAYYVLAYDQTVDKVFDALDFGEAAVKARRQGPFTVEMHISYLDEVRLDDPLEFSWRVLDYDSKRLHHFAEMRHAEKGYLAATFEQMTLNVDLDARKSTPLAEGTRAAIADIWTRHQDLPRPPQVGARIGIRRKVA